MDNTTKKSDAFFFTRDTKLASFLIACGHDPSNPPLTHVEETETGKKWFYWDFEESLNYYGDSLDDTIGVWKQGNKYIIANPDKEISMILKGILTYAHLLEALNRKDLDNTLVSYEVNGSKFAVLKGSGKEKEIIQMLKD